ncbi:MAG: phage terminase large subunit [Bdellovibrionaceae bacterium]|nr:phage terminase large subunit [Pseudobdellovibrionaceae bacterium]
MPPRAGKSLYTSLYLPAWFLATWPEKNVILTSYEATFAASWGRKVRNFLSENSLNLDVTLSPDSLASDRWNTTKGGGMITAGIGGPITGRGGHLIIIDDPIKNSEEASSETIRKKHIDWFNSTLYTRAEPGASIVLLMTRWHQMDLAGYLLKEHSKEWKEIKLPALAEDNDPLGRKLGEALCPERYDIDALESIKRTVGTRVWDALYQQRPSIEDGNIFKRHWFKFYQTLPDSLDNMIISCDLTFKDTKNSDYAVLQVWGKKGANKYLIDQIRERLDFPNTIRALTQLTQKYPHAHTKLIEDKANGPAVIATLRNKIPGLIAVEPSGSKEARASSVSADIEAGNVYLPSPTLMPWVNDFIEECANFPFAQHDDCVDAMSYALIRLRQSSPIFAPISGHSMNYWG